MTYPTLYQERSHAVRRLVDQAREIEKTGVTHANLDKIGGLLADLARRADLFPQDEFPLGSDGGIYRLSEDPDHRFALYASAGGPGKKVPPHNHTTWAVIAGVHGAERNVVYDRLDNGARDGFVQLREAPAKEKTLKNGDFISYLPDDFHHIETPAGSGTALHLHFYGLGLDHLPDRVSVDMASGTAKRFMAKAKILTPLLGVQQVKAMLKSERGLRLLRRARGGRVLDQGPSAVRHAASRCRAWSRGLSPCCPIPARASC